MEDAARPGVVFMLPAFDNIDVYPLPAALIRVAPRSNDGTLADLKLALANKGDIESAADID
jgi:hypothetical protein